MACKPYKWKRIEYGSLRNNNRHQESYLFQHAAAALARCGFSAVKLTTDWNGADCVAQHFQRPQKLLQIQLKSRFTIDTKYIGKRLHICFPDAKHREWWLLPHDTLVALCEKQGYLKTDSWRSKGCWHSANPSTGLRDALAQWKLPSP